jgi:acetyl-CoA synthetase
VKDFVKYGTDREMRITDYKSYEEAKKYFEFSQVWNLFDGNEKEFNIAHECIDRHVGTGIAVRIKFDDGHTEEYSFDEISKRSFQFANALEAMNVNFGDRVAIMLDPSIEFYVSLFGALKRGAIAVPCYTQFGPEALKQRLDDSKSKILIVPEDKVKEASGGSHIHTVTSGARFRQLLENKSEKYTPRTSSKDIAVYQYTSGTTRRYPEAIKHYHRSIATLMPAAVFGRGLKKGDRFFCPSSPVWGHGLWHGTFSPLALGITTGAYSGKFDAEKLLEALEQFEINNISAVPTVYRMIKDSGLASKYRLRINKISYSGEPMDIGTFNFLRDTFGVPPHSGYGSTEGGAVIPRLDRETRIIGKTDARIGSEAYRRRWKRCSSR